MLVSTGDITAAGLRTSVESGGARELGRHTYPQGLKEPVSV